MMTSLVCWGSATYGQLGIGSVEEGKVSYPRVSPELKEQEIEEIACGESHTLFRLKDGKVYSCGNNEQGQLGHSKRTTRPERVDKLSSQIVTDVTAGSSHSLAKTVAGEVFSWGSNRKGQLGREADDDTTRLTPKLVKQLIPYSVIQICCGNYHSLALSDDGRVFSWGYNRYGQLGVGHASEDPRPPQFIACLRGIPVAQIAAGGNHSFVLSRSGAVFGWGRNSFGQLGVNDEKDRPHPTLCKSLRSQKVKYIACGEDHTATLTQSGGVFTFGAGSYGQLGHSSRNNEILPKKVIELMGSEVTQIACGRRHTLAFVADSRRIYSFGSGACGQLGIEEPSIKTAPAHVKGPFLSSKRSNAMETDGDNLLITKIFSGGDHCFVVAEKPKEGHVPADYREHSAKHRIHCLTPQNISRASQLSADEPIPVEFEEELVKIFNSASCINASFLQSDDNHFNCTTRNHGVDMEAVRKSFDKLSQAPNVCVIQKITECIEGVLIPVLPSSPPDVEALRVYLILHELHLFEQSKRFSSLISPVAKSIIHLEKPASRVLDLWWGSLPQSFFFRILSIYKEAINYMLHLMDPSSPSEMETRRYAILMSLEMLKKLNNVNEQNCQIVPYHKFYITELKDKVNIKADYIHWTHQQQNKTSTSMRSLLFCDYPFIFDAAAKSLLLQTDAFMQMKTAIEEVQRRNFQSLFAPIDPVNPCLVFHVTRNNIVADTIHQLVQKGSGDLKKPMKVIFHGEEAMDEGGVRKEFFLLLLREVLDPKYGMFRWYEESRLQWFSPLSFEEHKMYLLVGCLCGLAIYNSIIIQLDFPLALFKKLLKRQPNLDDLKELMPTVGKSFEDLLEYEEDDFEDTFCLSFEIGVENYGESKTIELLPGGSSKTVTKENRKEFVDLYVDYVFNKATAEQFQAFNDGFHKVCGGRVLELFHPQELRAMVIGNENYDFHELEKNTSYKGDYHRYHPAIKFFWDVFHDLSLEDKKKFLLFLTGSDKIPIVGMKEVKILIQPVFVEQTHLPVAHTCFNLLDLPVYKTKEVLKDKLTKAIQQTEGFGLV